jgi:hypothetical protein
MEPPSLASPGLGKEYLHGFDLAGYKLTVNGTLTNKMQGEGLDVAVGKDNILVGRYWNIQFDQFFVSQRPTEASKLIVNPLRQRLFMKLDTEK